MKQRRWAYIAAGVALALAAISLSVPFAMGLLVGLGHSREPDPRDISLSSLKQLALSVLSYADYHEGLLPPLQDPAAMAEALQRYHDAGGYRDVREFLTDPVGGRLYQPNPTLASRKWRAIPRPERMVMLYEAAPAEDGKRAVAFVDAHCKRVTKEEWSRLKRESMIPRTEVQPASALKYRSKGKRFLRR